MRKDVERIPREERCLLNKSELARRLGCDRRTVTRQLKIVNGDITPQSNKREYKTKLEGFESVIKEKIDIHGCSAMAVYKLIKKKGFDGKYTIVADFVRNHKEKEIKKATIRYETAPGLQAQVDWKENLIMVSKHGEIFSVNIFLMVLGYSRVKFLSLTIDRNQDTLFRCMIERFKHFRGVPNEILFDNMLISYIFRKKEYKATKESMFKYKGKKYSVPTKYIGDKVSIDENQMETCMYIITMI